MKTNKVVKMPFNRTRRREKQLERLQVEAELRKGNRINFLKFCGLIIFFAILVTLFIFITSKASVLTPVIVGLFPK